MREAQELKDPTEEYFAQPLEDNLFEWHFTVKGPADSPFSDGYYHGRIILPTEYPMKPPSIILLTPNGRFETNKKICLSISGYHPESWQPGWSIRTALLAIIGFMPTPGKGAIGSLDYSDAERRDLAIKSQSWKCDSCGLAKNLLKPPSLEASTSEEALKQEAEQKALAAQIVFENKPSTSSTSSEIDSQQDQETSSSETAATAMELTRRTRTSTPSVPSSSINTPVASDNLNSPSPSNFFLSSYFIVGLVSMIAFLLFRRLFLLE